MQLMVIVLDSSFHCKHWMTIIDVQMMDPDPSDARSGELMTVETEAFVAGALWYRLRRCVVGLVLFDSEGQSVKEHVLKNGSRTRLPLEPVSCLVNLSQNCVGSTMCATSS